MCSLGCFLAITSNYTGQGNTLHCETIPKTHVCVFGFVQPYPFLTKVLPSIVADADGLYDRFLVCAPKVHRLHIYEVSASAQRWLASPQHHNDFCHVIQAVNNAHDSVGPRMYSLTDEAMHLYSAFNAQHVDDFNTTWGLEDDTSGTKDTRYVLRSVCWPSSPACQAATELNTTKVTMHVLFLLCECYCCCVWPSCGLANNYYARTRVRRSPDLWLPI